MMVVICGSALDMLLPILLPKKAGQEDLRELPVQPDHTLLASRGKQPRYGGELLLC
jgi:hypothetical protein